MLIGELNPFIPVYRITKKTRYDLTISKRVNILIDSIDPNIIMCVNTYAYFLTRIGQLFSNKKSIVLSPHSTIPFSLYNYFQNLIYLRFVQKSDQILYLCEAQRLFLNKTYKMPKHQNSIVYNGVDTQYFNPIMIQHNTENGTRVDQFKNDLIHKSELIDPSVKSWIEAEFTRLEKQVEGIKNRLEKSVKSKYEKALKSIEQLKEKLFPANGMQERSFNFFQFCPNGNYKNKLQNLYTAIEPFDSSILILIED
jgi:hypothetical protein